MRSLPFEFDTERCFGVASFSVFRRLRKLAKSEY